MILTYNQESFVEQAVDSVVNQKTDYRFEVIISDDHSSDDTASVLHYFKDKYPNKIKLIIREKNLGMPNNYYETLKLCKGRYIMSCAGDDYFLPTKIQEQVKFMDENRDVGMYCGQVYLLFNRKKKLKSEPTKECNVSLDGLLESNCIYAITTCIRKEVLQDYLKEVNPMQHDWMMEDYPMALWMVRNSRIAMSDRPFAVYRQIHGSVSHPDNLMRNLEFTRSTYDIAMFFAESPEQKRIAQDSYDYAEAENHWLFGNMNGYRSCYVSKLYARHRGKDRIKYMLSYVPGMGRLVKWRFINVC